MFLTNNSADLSVS